jgi:hypothetical protein
MSDFCLKKQLATMLRRKRPSKLGVHETLPATLDGSVKSRGGGKTTAGTRRRTEKRTAEGLETPGKELRERHLCRRRPVLTLREFSSIVIKHLPHIRAETAS